ncbi:MAG: pectin lyase fold protein [Ramlibacter sp.]|uniref:right-handed parallel beta-helix repeat-containing protein n=1 Tax=Ramlibacter sp. TaxID=1917967 RepID=UPI00261E5E2B|nr:right-handed parallel beta-helix repeat-containing protein [Ramlibacter sp.]MDB5751311.1 pectin lyase fold protein [Ramlibacter sp.]
MVRFLLTLAVAVCTPVALAQIVHLSPTGRDTNDGLTEARPVATLQRALDVALRVRRQGPDVLVQVAPGRYVGQAAVTGARTDGARIRISGNKGDVGGRPEFIGDRERTLTWLTMKSAVGKPTRMVISGLRIREYRTAISLEGNRDRADAFNAGNTIRNNFFEHIGSLPGAGKNISTAAIRLVNSKDNLIENNRFETIRNAEGCSALHAIYAAHFSSGNIIRGNRFSDLCGSVIKLRDRSNGNLIEGNIFTRLDSVPAVEEWYCDKSARKDCTKKLGECPSTGNRVKDNQLQSADGKLVDVLGGSERRAWCHVSDFAGERILVGSARPAAGVELPAAPDHGSRPLERGRPLLENGIRWPPQAPAWGK